MTLFQLRATGISIYQASSLHLDGPSTANMMMTCFRTSGARPTLTVRGRHIQMHASSRTVKIVEVGPRDGLQNESVTLEPAVRAALIGRLAGHGLKHIEAGSFVSPKLKQMAGTRDVLLHPSLRSLSADACLSVLVPNMRGLRDLVGALQDMQTSSAVNASSSYIQEVAVFVSATESFSKANLNTSIAQSLEQAAEVIQESHSLGFRTRGYVSCVLGCPFEGKVQPSQVRIVADALKQAGCHEISLGDTIGVGTPSTLETMLADVTKSVSLSHIALHCHDTYGAAVANVLHAARLGVRTFDSSVAGLGGCPFAPGASGNVATEDILYALHTEGYNTGVVPHNASASDLIAYLLPLAQTGQWISGLLGKTSNSKVGQAVLAKNNAQTTSKL